jgi:hypothetical protein
MTLIALDEAPPERATTRSVTFRMDNTLIDELQREADLKDVSMNVLVNHVLRRYKDWDRYETEVGMMPVPKVMLSSIIEEAVSMAHKSGVKDIDPYRDKIVKEAAKTAFSLMKDQILFMKKNYDLWTVLSVLQEYMKVSGIKSDHKMEGAGDHVFIIQHELGENWSIFTKELLSMIFEDLTKVKADINFTANTVITKVRL